jgi:hypothetical protein
MNRSVLLSLFTLALAVTAFGCGPDKTDNSKNQTPDDQPIGMPSPLGEGKAIKGKSLPFNPTLNKK